MHFSHTAAANDGRSRIEGTVRSDRDLQRDILSSLDWEPGIDAARIGVTVENGTAILQGMVHSAFERNSAERVASHVYGVVAVINGLGVNPPEGSRRTDDELTEAVANALACDSTVPFRVLEVKASDGWVTLTGAVEWQFQRAAAQIAAERVDGVKGVNNHIVLTPRVSSTDLKARIESAFKRSAVIDAARVKTETHDSTVVLTGSVRSLSERTEAENAAWNAPGVTRVDNRLIVSFD
jgi:osmotically-inducible protein OsmY